LFVLYGRDAEVAVLAELLDHARHSRSGVLVVHGPAGIGKSALLAEAVSRAHGRQVLHAIGIESESALAFAALHQLLRPIVHLIDEIPQPQATALRGALGMASAPGNDLFLVGAGVLSLLARAADERPVFCVVEDAHWLDAPSAAALAFAARRLQADPIALVFSERDDEPSRFPSAGLPDLGLKGLDAEAATTLLAERLGVSMAARVRESLIEFAAGNPLVLLELPLALSAEQLAGRQPVAEPLPLTARLEKSFSHRARALPGGSQLLLLLAAADNTHDPAVLLEAARSLGITSDEIQAVEAAGLLRLDERNIEFRHALVRSAVYRTATLLQRQAAHRALAETLTDERYADGRAWQLAAATIGPDDDAADELERSAERARSRGGHAGAAAALARSASLTTEDEQRARRLLAAAQSASQAGQNHLAAAMLDDARKLATSPALVPDIERLRGVIELEIGSPAVAQEILLGAASSAEQLDPPRAASILLDAAGAAVYGGDLHAQIEVGHRAEDLRRKIGASFELSVSAGLGSLWEGARQGRALLGDALIQADSSKHPDRFLWAASCALHLGDEKTARHFATRAAGIARREGAVARLVTALSRGAFAEILEGHFMSARVNASESLALAEQAGLDNVACYDHALLAWIAALLGRPDESHEHADAALALARGNERAWQASVATLALGELELGLGRAVEALARFEALSTTHAHPYLSIRATPSLIEAAVRAKRADVALEVLRRFEAWVTTTGSVSQLAVLSRCRALVADADAARTHFEEALDRHAEINRPFDRARTEFLYGEHLRRGGLRREARIHLGVAVDLFSQLEASSWAHQAEAGLRASGQTARASEPAARDELTPQELQIARLVATGTTNKRVAAQLFLSPRTVDAHLRNIFRKLGITGRAELRSLRLGDPDDVSAASSR
jgi:DNA-binding CsgD family transcriptional regulator